MGRGHHGRRRASGAPDAGSVRIIGGAWRGRRLAVPALPGLRPTADRIRETLFNWLAPELAGARCLDLFAGSGALGLEALSRGAAHCDFVESQATAIHSLREAMKLLGAGDRAAVYPGDALAFLDGAAAAYDIVFLDPPFDSDIMDEALAALVRGSCLSNGALVYLEYAAQREPHVPRALTPHRERRTPTLVYALYRHAEGNDGRL